MLQVYRIQRHQMAAELQGQVFGTFFGSSQLLLWPYFLSLRAYFWNLFGVLLSLRACFRNILGSVPGLLLEWTEELAFVLLFLKSSLFKVKGDSDTIVP